MVSCSSSDIRDVDLGKSDFRRANDAIELFSWWQIYACNLTELGGKRWAIRSQHGHTEGFVYCLSDHISPANSSAFLALKQGVEMKAYVGRVAIEFKACGRSQCSFVDICTELLWVLGSMCTTERAVLFG